MSPGPRLVAASTAAALVVTLPGVPAGLRILVGAWFLCVCPGLAWVRFLPVHGPIEQGAAAVGLSLALDVVVAEVLLFCGLPGLFPAALVLAAIAVAGITVAREPVPV